MERLRAHFFSGLLVLTPVFLTLLVIRYLVRLADVFIVDPVFEVLPFSDADPTFKVILMKLLIAALVVGFVVLIGILAEKVMVRQLLRAGDAILKNIPVFNKIYGSIREIAQAFFGDKKGVFKRVVYVEYPRKGMYALAFVTQDRPWDIHSKTGRDVLTVFVPSPPNPATGNFVFAPKEEIMDAGITVEEGIKLVISGGAVVPSK